MFQIINGDNTTGLIKNNKKTTKKLMINHELHFRMMETTREPPNCPSCFRKNNLSSSATTLLRALFYGEIMQT